MVGSATMAYVMALFCLVIVVVTVVGTKLLEILVLKPLAEQRRAINRVESGIITQVVKAYDRTSTHEERKAARRSIEGLAEDLVSAELPSWLVNGGFGIDRTNLWDAHRYLLTLGQAIAQERRGELSAEAQAEEIARLLDFDREVLDQFREAVDDKRLAPRASQKPKKLDAPKPSRPPPVKPSSEEGKDTIVQMSDVETPEAKPNAPDELEADAERSSPEKA